MSEQNLVLIVDDSTTNIGVLADVLETAGFYVLAAKSGETALTLLETLLPDLIVLDVILPGIDGFETCDRIKSNPDTQEIPVIFMTALTDAADKVKGLNLGAIDYITKPFQQVEVLARVETHIKLRRQTRQLKDLNEKLEQRVAERTNQLSQSLSDLQYAQIQLVQQEKMSMLGQLVSGVGHEINNPLNSMTGNLRHAGRYIQDLVEHLQLYEQYYPNPVEPIAQNSEEIDLPFLLTDLPRLFSTLEIAADRMNHISRALRTFSRSDQTTLIELNLQEGLDSTLLLLQHRLNATSDRPAIQVTREYQDLPPIFCYPGQLNQVFMNLLANAIDAIDEANRGRSYNDIVENPNQIYVATEFHNDQALVRIRDNGIGISEEVQQEIFKPSFTTKPVGKGTGLGLAIAHQIIVEKHQGSLTCQYSPQAGTEFTIALPYLAE
ncbi:MAG: response regulator [Leptolyngbya sp. Prado105]|jgi:signal transduction histidine kinase|nr:response regulator [Leptolyngbya sp. Prado105]